MRRSPRAGQLSKVTGYLSLVLRLPGALRRPVSSDDARSSIRFYLDHREEHFLSTAKRYIFGRHVTPYRRMFDLAGCEYGDLEKAVRSDGLEPTLRKLREENVYLKFEEFKGRQPIVRSGRQMGSIADIAWRDMRGLVAGTSGTTGSPIETVLTIDRFVTSAWPRLIAYDAFGVLDRPKAVWRERPPSLNGVVQIVHDAMIGRSHERWFAQSVAYPAYKRVGYRLSTWGISMATRLGGVRIPRAETVDLDEAARIVEWASMCRRIHGGCLLITGVSHAVRIARAALESGTDLQGMVIMASGEPPSPAKVEIVQRSGAAWLPHYTLTEVGRLGIGCARPASGSDMHLLDHYAAIVTYPRAVAGTQLMVEPFHFTSLVPATGLFLLNVESDDFGHIGHRACGCALEEVGFDRHISDIQSFAKLTGEGITLLGTDVIHILEGVLPARFGGSPLDYQLLEEEEEDGSTKLVLLVSPAVKLEESEEEVLAEFVRALGRSNLAREIASLWEKADSLRLRREPPRRTRAGKQLPIVPAALARG